MNAFTQLFGVALGILMSPFTNNSQLSGILNVHGDNSALIPSNLLQNRDASSVRGCPGFSFKMGENEVKVTLIPRGYCPNCCPVKFSRDIRFVYYNKTNPDKGTAIEQIIPGEARKIGIRSDLPTEIFIHGFSEPSPGKSGRTIIDAYLSREENYNVIMLDWSELATFPWYTPAVQNVKLVADKLRNFLEMYNDSGEIPIDKVHIIGFSLGSHIASFTGKLLRKDIRIPRITALDPAFPEYSLRDTSRRLTKSDADFIDVIHTDSGIFGFPLPIGDADFYPNGGRALQPGCQPSYLVQLNLVDQIFGCSHVRSWQLYSESVRNFQAFPATKCKVWRGPNKKCNFTIDTYMGYAINKTSKGQFYLVTNYNAPYSRSLKQDY